MSNLSRKLNTPQRRWCELVNAGMCRSKAAKEVWPHLSRPRQKAYELGRLPHIHAHLAYLDERATELAGVTRTFIMAQLKAVAGFDMRKLYNQDGSLKAVHELEEETAMALSAIEMEEVIEGSGDAVVRRRTKRVKHWSKTEALRLLAQIRGMTKEQVELSGPGGGPVKYERIEIVGVEPKKGDYQ